MTKKVTLPRDVAEAIEQLRQMGMSSYEIITGMEVAYDETDIEGKEYYDILNDRYMSVRTDELMHALVNGYEIEQSPEDKLREYYAELKGTYDSSSGLESYRVDGMLQSVETTLAILGIQIEGINA